MKKKKYSLLFIFITIFIDITALGIIIPIIPLPPLFVTLKSVNEVLFPYPFSVIERIYLLIMQHWKQHLHHNNRISYIIIQLTMQS